VLCELCFQFQFIYVQVLFCVPLVGDWLLITEFFVNILFSNIVVHEVECCLQH